MATSDATGDPIPNNNYIVVSSSTTTPTYIGGGMVGPSGSGGYVSQPYTITTGSTTWSGAWENTIATEECQFCDKEVKVGIFMKSKKGKKSFICVPCAKQHMGSEKMKDLLDLAEPVAVGEELAE